MFWLENLLSQATVERLGWMLVHFLWQATVVAVLLTAFLRLLRRSSANVRYLTACSALALMVVLPVATIRFIRVTGPAAEAGPLPAASAAVAPPAAIEVVGQMQPLSQVPDSLQDANPATVIPWNERIALTIKPALPYAVLGWLAGVFGLSAWHLGGWMQLQRLKRRMVRSVGVALQRQVTDLSSRLGVHRAVTLLESALVEVPTVVGWLRPVILLPASALTGLSVEQLEAILAHELAHIRRYDYLVNVLQTIVEILGFYHPAVWWVSRRIRIERENCCDDMAVHVCGDSVRYARALTCLEEIRHSQAELAMAATGGSLLGRISRLLGQPAPDDRRFAWLPGLITLLLVAGVVIPTALALATPTPRLPESPSDNAAVLPEKATSGTEPNEPAPAQVRLDFIVAEAFSDAILDQDTATKVVDLLARIPAGNARLTVAPAVPPSVEELQKPLADVLAKFAPRPGKSRHFVDWLVSRRYAQVICAPNLEVFAGQQASIATRDAPDPNATESQNREFTSMRLSVTPNEIQDQNATLLKMNFTLTRSSRSAADLDRRVDTSVIASTLVAPNDQYTLIIQKGDAQPMDNDGRTRLQLLLVQPTVNRPGATPSGKTGESPVSEPLSTNASVAANEMPDEAEASEPSHTEFELGFILAKAPADAVLDQQTAAKAAGLLVPIPTGNQRRQSAAHPTLAELQKPLGEVLSRFTIAPGKGREFIDLLGRAVPPASVLFSPKVRVPAGEQASFAVGDMPGSNVPKSQGFDFGSMRLTVTANETQDPNAARLDIGFTREYPVYKPGSANKETTTSTIHSTLVAPDGQYTSVVDRVMKGVDENGREWVALPLVRPVIVRRSEATSSLKTDGPPTSEPNTPKVSVRTEVSREPNAAEKTSVAVKVMMIETVDNMELDYETLVQVHNILGKPIIQPKGRAGESGRLHMTVGEVLGTYVVQQSLSDEAIQPIVELLASRGYMKVLSAPQVLVQDGMESQIKVVNNEYFWMGSSADGSPGKSELQKVEAGTTLDVTPHVLDDSNVLLDIKVELTHIVPGPNNAIPPVMSVRSVVATVTTPSGRYITLAGMGDTAKAKDSTSVYIMAMPTILPPVPPPAGATGVSTNGPASQTKRREESTPELKTRVLASSFAPSARTRIDYADFDPVCQELARKRVEIWGQLTADKQKLASNHPKIVQEQAMLDAIKKEMDDRKKSLKEEFEARLDEPGAGLAGNVARVRLDMFMADIFSKKVLDDQTAVEAVDIIGGAIPNLTAKDLCRPVGDVVRQCTQYRILSGPPLEAFIDLLVARGYIRPLANPTWLLPAGYRGQIKVSDNFGSPDDASELSLKFTVTPESRPGSDSVQLSLDVGGYRRATAEHGKQSARTDEEHESAGWSTKSGQYTAVSGVSHITWYDNQGNERMLFTMVKPTIIDPPPNPKPAAVPTVSQANNTIP
jgi:beta-lactamase regulating signal transducer with metallopeptidase domain